MCIRDSNYIAIGKGKVNTPVAKMFVLGILAGICIALGGVASSAAAVSIPLASVGKFLGACIFPGGRCVQEPDDTHRLPIFLRHFSTYFSYAQYAEGCELRETSVPQSTLCTSE